MRPECGIVVEETSGRDKRNHLEDGAAEGVLYIVVAHHHELNHNEDTEDRDEEDVESELGVAEQFLDLKLDDGGIEQCEVDTR